MPTRLPIVNYLVLRDDDDHLEAQQCAACGARFLGRRIACAACGQREFAPARLASTGTVGSMSIIHRAAAGVAAPYVSAIVDLDDGTTVKANVVNCDPTPEAVPLGLRVRFITIEAGTDSDGAVAVAFAYEPISAQPVLEDTQ